MRVFLLAIISCGLLALAACTGSDDPDDQKLKMQDSLQKISQNIGNVKVEMARDAKNLSIQRLRGYRVQIFTGHDRDEAMRAKSLFIKYFPDVDNYLEYEEPNYKVRVGDFLSKGLAQELSVKVNKIKGLEGCFVVKSMVNAELPEPLFDTVNENELVYYTLIDSMGKEVQIPILRSSLTKSELDSLQKNNKPAAVAPKPEALPKEPAKPKVVPTPTTVPPVTPNIAPSSSTTQAVKK